MGLSLVTGPTQDPVTLAETKAHLGVAIADDDGRIAGYILTARRYAETYTRRVFCTQTWDYTIDRCWPLAIRLPLPPLQSVTSISYIDSNGASQSLAADQYVVRTDEFYGFIEPAYSVTWPAVRDQSAAVTVRFVAGWTSVPDEIRSAIMLHVEMLYDRSPQDREILERARDALLDTQRIVEAY